ncbi:MAG: acetophenone carboxylase [Clostridia bacterium]|nr:MAG: acetophenone carboxylase [Clostridia bacterium]
MTRKVQITEYLDIDLEREMWCCNRCGRELISARTSYKQGCLVYEREPRDIYNPLVDEAFSFAPNPDWLRYLEFYCPGCGTMIEVEALPPGHPTTYDIELDVDALKRKCSGGGQE